MSLFVRGQIMKAVLIDDNAVCLETEAIIIQDIDEIDELHSFQYAADLLDYMSTTPVDIAFLDIIMDDSDGISLAMEIKKMQPDCKIVFISSSRDFALEAFQVYASGYLLKPVTKDEIINVLNNII